MAFKDGGQPPLGKPEGQGQGWGLGGWHTLRLAQGQDQRSSAEGCRLPQPASTTRQDLTDMKTHPPHPRGLLGRQSAENFVSKGSVLTVAKPLGRTELRMCDPSAPASLSPPVKVQTGEAAWPTRCGSASGFWLTGRQCWGYTGDPKPNTSVHRSGGLSP